MSPLEKGVIWMVAIIFFVFALCIGLSWYSFEYVDWKVVSTMGLMLLPILGAASIVVLWSERHARVTNPRRTSRKSEEAPMSTDVKPARGGF